MTGDHYPKILYHYANKIAVKERKKSMTRTQAIRLLQKLTEWRAVYIERIYKGGNSDEE